MTLTDFLLARIADDEETALGAVISDETWVDYDLKDGSGRSQILDSAGMVVGDLPERTAEHVAGWDPTRVIAECEAKRSIIELHPEILTICQGCGNESYPCRTLLALVQPYADHPDYDEAWRP